MNQKTELQQHLRATETPDESHSSSRCTTLWKGPRICSPAQDLKFLLTMCVIMRRGAPGSELMAGGGGGGMLARISSRLRLSSSSADSPGAASTEKMTVNQTTYINTPPCDFICGKSFDLTAVSHITAVKFPDVIVLQHGMKINK